MLLNFDHSNKVSRLDIWDTITLAMQRELLTIGRSLINFNLQSLILPLDLLSLADFATLSHIDHLALSPAFVARTRTLTIHARSHLSHDCSHSPTLTGVASLHC